MEIIWKDFNYMKLFLFIGVILIGWLSVYTITKDYKMQIYDFNTLASVLGIGFSVFFLYNLIRTKLIYISNEGIRIGNAPDDRYQHIKLKNKATFLKWNEIKSIKIERHQVRRMAAYDLIDFLVIKIKAGKKYQSFIARPKGFVNALKQLKKDHLLSKDSKYLDLLKI